MKATAFLLSFISVFCFSTLSNAQLNVSFNGFPNDEAENVLFRGFDNVLEITPIEDEFEYTIETENVNTVQKDISDDPRTKRYFVRIGTEKTVTFKFIKKGETAVFQTVTCQTSNMPDPYIHIDGVPSGGKISKNATSLSVQLLGKFRFESSYKIKRFSMFIADQVLSSSNVELTEEMRKMLEMSVSGDEISVNCDVYSQDGITRLIGGSFVVE